jgi:Stigma-specific protein, Stig1
MNEEPRERSFDELAKGLASGEVSRGKALRLMGAALVGGALVAIPGVAFARTPRTPPTGKGGCPQGRTLCRGKCYDLQTSSENCGQCGNVCSAGQVCQGGTCLGARGALCSSNSQCASGLYCSTGGTCEPCGPTTCATGCCDANGVCQPGTSNTACGGGGFPCRVCNTTRDVCAAGGCEPLCGPATCPNGCCETSTNTCLPGNIDAACGYGGEVCFQCDTTSGSFCTTSTTAAGTTRFCD